MNGHEAVGGLYGVGIGLGPVEKEVVPEPKAFYEVVAGTVTECYCGGDVVGTGDFIGGLAGENELDIKIVDCQATGSVSGSSHVGGLIGFNDYDCPVSSSYATGDVTGSEDKIGGLIGLNSQSEVSDCYATGSVSSPGDYVGGLVGHNEYRSILKSYATGDVSGFHGIGGLVGWQSSSSVIDCFAVGDVSGIESVIGGLIGASRGWVTNCFATGRVNGESFVGGLMGSYNGDSTTQQGLVSNCFALGMTSGNSKVGGLIGGVGKYGHVSTSFSGNRVFGIRDTGGFVASNSGTIDSNCYWDVEASQQSTSEGGVGRTTNEMKMAETFLGWDFETVWAIHQFRGYPILRNNPGQSDLIINVIGSPEVVHDRDDFVTFMIVVRNLSTEDVSAVEIGAQVPTQFARDWPDGNYRTYSIGTIGWGQTAIRYYKERLQEKSYLGETRFEVEIAAGYPNRIKANDFSDSRVVIGAPYTITSATELQAMIYDLTADYHLGSDIDASETLEWNDGAGFEPIGTDLTPFTGSFSGMIHKISNLQINRPTAHQVGLFGHVEGATLENVELLDVNIVGFSSVGGLVGHGNVTVSDCFVSGKISAIDVCVGGVIGNIQNSIVRNISASCVVSGEDAGGVVGKAGGGLIDNCHSSGEVSGSENIGGLVGSTQYSAIKSSYSIADVTAYRYVGGLIGDNQSTLLNCYARGRVICNSSGGGLVGTNPSGEVYNCYSVGSVSLGPHTGGLVGLYPENSGPVTNSYWDEGISEHSESNGGTGRTTVEMYSKSTYEGWDFDSVWWIDEGNDYPRLHWEPGAPPTPGPTFSNAGSDINLDNRVDAEDLLILLEDWGKFSAP
ncbi:MAG: hypothetical protein KC940_04790 [Candidatus Omnitrophica bacterium]|nr:hypothetical protein [Candidatus Omnitrophota bacterium]